jgi:hypothetical protein
MKNPWLWAIFGAICNLFAIALLHGNRWLKEGELRSGGRGWDSCRWLAICAGIFFFFKVINIMPMVISGHQRLGALRHKYGIANATAFETAYHSAFGIALFIGLFSFLWLLVAGGALICGFMLKKDVEEVGPTGPLATRV